VWQWRVQQDSVLLAGYQLSSATGWLSSLLSKIDKGDVLFFGPVDSFRDKTGQRIVGYLAEYAQFNSRISVGLDESPGNNIVCERSLLGDIEKLKSGGISRQIWCGDLRPRSA